MTDAVLIVGAGIAGLSAAQAIADAGARAIVVERQPVVGGRLAAAMTKAHAIGNRAEGEPVPLLDSLAANPAIEILTNATLESVSGRAGSFTVSVRQRARFVTDACTRCKKCHNVCPVVLPNEFDAGLTFRKAIFTPMITTLPAAWSIDIDHCLNTPPNYLPCNRCVEACEDDAIHFDEALENVREHHVAALVLAPGMQIQAGSDYTDLGYGAHPDVVTSAEMQRLLESPGPTGGFATRPSNEEYPESVLLVLDDPSPFGLYIASSQARQLMEQDIGSVAVLVLSQPAGDEAAAELRNSTGIEVHWGTSLRVEPGDDGAIAVSFEDFGEKRLVRQTWEMIVLYVDVMPPDDLATLAGAAGVEVAPGGYLAAANGNGAGVQTAVPGVFVAGCGTGPKNIRESIAEAKAAAGAALAQLSPVLLDGPGSSAAADAPAVPDDAMRAQIEKLLYALIDRT